MSPIFLNSTWRAVSIWWKTPTAGNADVALNLENPALDDGEESYDRNAVPRALSAAALSLSVSISSALQSQNDDLPVSVQTRHGADSVRFAAFGEEFQPNVFSSDEEIVPQPVALEESDWRDARICSAPIPTAIFADDDVVPAPALEETGWYPQADTQISIVFLDQPAGGGPPPVTPTLEEEYQLQQTLARPLAVLYSPAADEDLSSPAVPDEPYSLDLGPRPAGYRPVAFSADDEISAPAAPEEDYQLVPLRIPERFVPTPFSAEDEVPTPPAPLVAEEDYWYPQPDTKITISFVDYPAGGGPPPAVAFGLLDEYWFKLGIPPVQTYKVVFTADEDFPMVVAGDATIFASFPQRTRYTTDFRRREFTEELPAPPLNLDESDWQPFPVKSSLSFYTPPVGDEIVEQPIPLNLDEDYWFGAPKNIVLAKPCLFNAYTIVDDNPLLTEPTVISLEWLVRARRRGIR